MSEIYLICSNILKVRFVLHLQSNLLYDHSSFYVLLTANVFRLQPIQRYLLISQANMSSSPDESGPIQKAITDAIVARLQPLHLEVVNESYMHNVSKGSETHFKVLVVSDKFESLPLIKVSFSAILSHKMLPNTITNFVGLSF